MARVFRVLAVSLFLVGFPLGSWYYLNKGYEYRIAIIEELNQNLGTVPNFKLVNQKGEKIEGTSVKNKVIIHSFLNLEADRTDTSFVGRLHTIQDQFDKKDDIAFYTYVETNNSEELLKYYKGLQIAEEDRWLFLTGTDDLMSDFIRKFPLPEEQAGSYIDNRTVAISDTSGIIRYYYNFRDKRQAGKLIEHIANLMPQTPPEEARMKRELEK